MLNAIVWQLKFNEDNALILFTRRCEIVSCLEQHTHILLSMRKLDEATKAASTNDNASANTGEEDRKKCYF